MNPRAANRAYRTAASHRTFREQEADLFRHANAGLRRIQRNASTLARVKALADNDRLWFALVGTLKDPDNQLPPALRGALVSVGLAVQREMRAPEPDLAFLIEVNEHVAAGLSGNP